MQLSALLVSLGNEEHGGTVDSSTSDDSNTDSNRSTLDGAGVFSAT